ncbi:hypothetical protein E4U17_005048 [Claviceps sp. LM77 group G4]|nr:hypothetical protein E4U17_005048 [Claviceps sp. LM77 group G4]KAG6053098.1 hypothetical protein E4U33_000310 [Claviceps sp. LM78 group G4]KAG6069655.1 hypothetical protein E4U16_007531 [Claviceps sp. LM84 group G4]
MPGKPLPFHVANLLQARPDMPVLVSVTGLTNSLHFALHFVQLLCLPQLAFQLAFQLAVPILFQLILIQARVGPEHDLTWSSPHNRHYTVEIMRGMKQKLHTDPLGPFTKHTVESIEESDSGPMPTEFEIWTGPNARSHLPRVKGVTRPSTSLENGHSLQWIEK